MYVLDLQQLFNQEGFRQEIDYQADFTQLDVNGQCPFREPVRIHGTLQNEAQIVTMSLTVDADCFTQCDRCTTDITEHLSIPMDHTLVLDVNRDQDVDQYIVVPDKKLDLEALASEDLLLNMPSKFLCSEDCKGLCPTCGKNLNDGPCDCEKEVDPRLAALANLKLDEE